MSLTVFNVSMENASKYVAGSIYGIKDFSKAKSVLGTAEKFGKISKVLGGAGIALTVVDGLTNPDGFQLHHGIDVVMGGLSMAFPIFGFAYGIADLGSQMFTHKSISEHVQDVYEDLR